MANLFAAESDQMTTTAGDVDGVNSEVQGELGRIRGVVDGLAGEWKGQAKDSFDDLMLRWDDAAMRLSNALTDIADNIRANSSSFDAGEDEGGVVVQAGGSSGCVVAEPLNVLSNRTTTTLNHTTHITFWGKGS